MDKASSIKIWAEKMETSVFVWHVTFIMPKSKYGNEIPICAQFQLIAIISSSGNHQRIPLRFTPWKLHVNVLAFFCAFGKMVLSSVFTESTIVSPFLLYMTKSHFILFCVSCQLSPIHRLCIKRPTIAMHHTGEIEHAMQITFVNIDRKSNNVTAFQRPLFGRRTKETMTKTNDVCRLSTCSLTLFCRFETTPVLFPWVFLSRALRCFLHAIFFRLSVTWRQ